jgi:hypothetical protein
VPPTFAGASSTQVLHARATGWTMSLLAVGSIVDPGRGRASRNQYPVKPACGSLSRHAEHLPALSTRLPQQVGHGRGHIGITNTGT